MRAELVRRAMLPAFLLVALSYCGPVFSVNPLADPAGAKADRQLAGLWAKEGKDEGYLVIASREDSQTMDMILVMTESSGAEVLEFEFFPSTIGRVSILNLRERSHSLGLEGQPALASEYLLARYELTPEGKLHLWYIDDEVAGDAVDEGALEGRKEPGKYILTSSTAALVDFVSKSDPERLFTSFGTWVSLRRPSQSQPAH